MTMYVTPLTYCLIFVQRIVKIKYYESKIKRKKDTHFIISLYKKASDRGRNTLLDRYT